MNVCFENLVYFISFLHSTISILTVPSQHQGQFTPHISHYQTFVPRKVDAERRFVSFETPHFYNLHHERIRRSVLSKQDAYVRYTIPVEGREFVVELWPNSEFLSPGFVVERWRRDIRKTKIQRPVQEQCHYVGHVTGYQSSRAALSACQGGLVGHMILGNVQFFVEPAAKHWPDASGRHVHLVYRNSVLKSKKRKKREVICESKSYCRISSNWKKAWEERLEWELANNPDGIKLKGKFENYSSVPRFIQTLIVADKKFINYHEDHDVVSYILTLMNMVSDHFHDSSLGRPIDVSVVRILLLSESDDEFNLSKNTNSSKILTNFSLWAKDINPSDYDHPNHHDMALLLTKQNICNQNVTECNILGLSSVASICKPGESASINQDTGLQTGLTITHGIGHALGCAHDDKQKEGDSGCYALAPNGHAYIMSHMMQSFTSTWSKCSKTCISTFLDSSLGYCLLNEPRGQSFKGIDMPSGAMYDAGFQCRDLVGSRDVCHVRSGEICRELWCEMANGTCVSRGWPAADGTRCGAGRWCWGGECVVEGRRPASAAAADGAWSQWGDWSACSRSCGGGVEAAERRCDRPAPAGGGRYCAGERRRVRVCNIERCDLSKPSFREMQCAEFDKKPYQGKLYKWKPFYEESQNNCELLCFNDVPFFASLAPMVKDGTPCRKNTRDMCVGGRCMSVGCDWVLGSDAVEDTCGECGGDGSHCRLVQKLYQEPHGEKYVKIADIPAKSYQVTVEEVLPSNNTIAVASRNKQKFYLNGNFKENHNGEYKFGVGVTGVYSHPETERELLVIEGPTTEELSVFIAFYDQPNPGVRVSYYERTNSSYVPNYDWEFVNWNPCSRRCGGGSQMCFPSCVERKAGIVSSSFCDQSIKPEPQCRVCNLQDCFYHWRISSWSLCSTSDNTPGEQHRKVECVRENSIVEEDSIPVNDSLCMGEKPVENRKCRFQEYSAETLPKNTEDMNEQNRVVEINSGAHDFESSTLSSSNSNRKKNYFNKHRHGNTVACYSIKRTTCRALATRRMKTTRRVGSMGCTPTTKRLGICTPNNKATNQPRCKCTKRSKTLSTITTHKVLHRKRTNCRTAKTRCATTEYHNTQPITTHRPHLHKKTCRTTTKSKVALSSHPKSCVGSTTHRTTRRRRTTKFHGTKSHVTNSRCIRYSHISSLARTQGNTRKTTRVFSSRTCRITHKHCSLEYSSLSNHRTHDQPKAKCQKIEIFHSTTKHFKALSTRTCRTAYRTKSSCHQKKMKLDQIHHTTLPLIKTTRENSYFSTRYKIETTPASAREYLNTTSACTNQESTFIEIFKGPEEGEEKHNDQQRNFYFHRLALFRAQKPIASHTSPYVPVVSSMTSQSSKNGIAVCAYFPMIMKFANVSESKYSDILLSHFSTSTEEAIPQKSTIISSRKVISTNSKKNTMTSVFFNTPAPKRSIFKSNKSHTKSLLNSMSLQNTIDRNQENEPILRVAPLVVKHANYSELIQQETDEEQSNFINTLDEQTYKGKDAIKKIQQGRKIINLKADKSLLINDLRENGERKMKWKKSEKVNEDK